jgi:hypothetical protein
VGRLPRQLIIGERLRWGCVRNVQRCEKVMVGWRVVAPAHFNHLRPRIGFGALFGIGLAGETRFAVRFVQSKTGDFLWVPCCIGHRDPASRASHSEQSAMLNSCRFDDGFQILYETIQRKLGRAVREAAAAPVASAASHPRQIGLSRSNCRW